MTDIKLNCRERKLSPMYTQAKPSRASSASDFTEVGRLVGSYFNNIIISYSMYLRPQLLVLCKLNEDLKPKTDNLFSFVGQLKAGKRFLTAECSN